MRSFLQAECANIGTLTTMTVEKDTILQGLMASDSLIRRSLFIEIDSAILLWG